jgi:hypothetical protein
MIDYCFDVMLHMDPGHPSTQVDINKQRVEIAIFSCDIVVLLLSSSFSL